MQLRVLFENNRKWAESIRSATPDFFARLDGEQNPTYLWIGCCDSRVPASTIVGLDPGELFVHRNVGNVVTHSDLNCLSAIQYSVDVLGVSHVIVCGHYGCGAVRDVWNRGGEVAVHGWMYRLDDGLLRDMDVSVASHDELAGLVSARAAHAEKTRKIALANFPGDLM
jgi:carbonic anhydrase